MSKKRTCCIGWTKGLQRMKAEVLRLAPSIGPEQAGGLMNIVTAQHRARVAAIRARNAETRRRQSEESRQHNWRRFEDYCYA